MASEIELTDTEIDELVAAGEYFMLEQLHTFYSHSFLDLADQLKSDL